MPYPAPYWTAKTFPGAKSLNLALYADDGTITGVAGAPTGIWFLARRPLVLQSVLVFTANLPVGAAVLLYANYGGPGGYSQVYVDNSVALGLGTDYPGLTGKYWYVPGVPVSSGAAAGPYSGAGGWTVFCHFAPMSSGAAQEAVAAQLYQAEKTPSGLTLLATGSWQASDAARDNCPFILDLISSVPPSGYVITPGVWITDGTGSDTYTLEVNDADSSGATARFFSFWAGAETWDAPDSTPALPAPVTSWTPASAVSASLLNGHTGIADVINFLQYPPMYRTALATSQTILNQENTVVGLAITPNLDSFSGQVNTDFYEIQRPGLYLCHAATAWAANSSGQRVTGLQVQTSGPTVTYWGPGYPAPASGICVSTKTQILSLEAGDYVAMICRQNSGGSLDLDSNHQCRMLLTWLGETGAPSPLWSPPDPSYRWQAGAKGRDLPGLFTAHLANDLGFLCQHPYFLGYQATAQTGLSQDAFHSVTLDTIQGIVHGDNGDPWGGWSSGGNAWAAPVPGWYLAVGEMFATAPSGTAATVAALSVPTSGGVSPSATPDNYQQMLASTNASLPSGGTIAGMYYLLAGETIQPQVKGLDYGTTLGTSSGTSMDGGTTASQLGIVWLSE